MKICFSTVCFRCLEHDYSLLTARFQLQRRYLDSSENIAYSYQINDKQEAMPQSKDEDRLLELRNWQTRCDENGGYQLFSTYNVIHFETTLKTKILGEKQT